MEKQKICVIGGGLTGLITATVLSKLNIKVDIIGNINQNTKSNRTTSISEDNYNFLKKLKIFKFSKKEFWPCEEIKLYTENEKRVFGEIFELKSKQVKNKQIMYMMENSKIIKSLIKNIKKNKLVSLKSQGIVSEVVSKGLLKGVKPDNKNNSKYNLIIICTGSNSGLVQSIFNNQFLKHSYGEISVTTTVRHSSFNNTVARQIFMNNGIFALLPISNTKTSVVWHAKKNIISKYKNKKKFFLKNKIKFYTKNFLKKIKFVNNLEYIDLNFLISKQYYQDRVLLFGDALHLVHPLVGQGFNMTLRDLANLEKILETKINLGLDIGGSDILLEFSEEIKTKNFIYSMGINYIKNCFSIQKKYIKNIRNKFIRELNKNDIAKIFLFNLANKGFKFKF